MKQEPALTDEELELKVDILVAESRLDYLIDRFAEDKLKVSVIRDVLHKQGLESKLENYSLSGYDGPSSEIRQLKRESCAVTTKFRIFTAITLIYIMRINREASDGDTLIPHNASEDKKDIEEQEKNLHLYIKDGVTFLGYAETYKLLRKLNHENHSNKTLLVNMAISLGSGPIDEFYDRMPRHLLDTLTFDDLDRIIRKVAGPPCDQYLEELSRRVPLCEHELAVAYNLYKDLDMRRRLREFKSTYHYPTTPPRKNGRQKKK